MDQIELTIVEGKEADKLLANPVLTKALQGIEDDATRRMVSSSPDDREGREQSYFLIKAVGHLRIKLNAMKGNGLMEADRLEKQQRRTRKTGVKK